MEYIFSVLLVIFSLNMLILYKDKRKFITFPERVQRWIVFPNGLFAFFQILHQPIQFGLKTM